MQNIGPITLTPNVALPFPVRGNTVQFLSSGNSAGLTVQFLQGGQVQYTVENVLTGWKIKPAGGFDSMTIESATGDTISAIVTAGDIDVQILNLSAQIENTSANPVPVSLISEPGAPFPVQAVPAGSVATDIAPVAVATSGAALIAASAGRKSLRVRNAGPGNLAITAAAGTVFGNAAVILAVGDLWIETDAPQAEWFAVSDSGTTANVQVVA